MTTGVHHVQMISNVHRAKPAWIRLVHALPLLFAMGYLLTAHSLVGFEVQYFGLTVITAIGATMLLHCLNGRMRETLPIWVMLAVFVTVYYLQFYVMLVRPEFTPRWLAQYISPMLDAPHVLIRSYKVISYGFITFCLTASPLLRYSKSAHLQVDSVRVNYRNVFELSVWAVMILISSTTFVMHVTGICMMSADSVHLPFRMAGWIFYVRTTFVPLLVVLCAWCSQRTHRKEYMYVTVVLAVLHGISDMLLTGSKGTLLVMFTMLALFFVLSRSFTRAQSSLFAFVLLFTVVFAWPLFATYRNIRAKDRTLPIVEALSLANDNAFSAEGKHLAADTIIESCGLFFYRLLGAGILLIIVDADVPPLILEKPSTSVNKFLTADLMGVPVDANTTYGSSLFGWFYLVGGTSLVVVGVFSWTILVWAIWRYLFWLRLYCIQVAQVLLVFLVFSISSNGGLDDQYLRILAAVGSIVVCELMVRRFGLFTLIKKRG
ncbi:hypothetical protein ACFL6U_09490 [Planctomycetota bacterium]